MSMVKWRALKCMAQVPASWTWHFKTSTMSGLGGAHEEDAVQLIQKMWLSTHEKSELLYSGGKGRVHSSVIRTCISGHLIEP